MREEAPERSVASDSKTRLCAIPRFYPCCEEGKLLDAFGFPSLKWGEVRGPGGCLLFLLVPEPACRHGDRTTFSTRAAALSSSSVRGRRVAAIGTHAATRKCPCRSAHLNPQYEKAEGREQTRLPLRYAVSYDKSLFCICPCQIPANPVVRCAP